MMKPMRMKSKDIGCIYVKEKAQRRESVTSLESRKHTRRRWRDETASSASTSTKTRAVTFSKTETPRNRQTRRRAEGRGGRERERASNTSKRRAFDAKKLWATSEAAARRRQRRSSRRRRFKAAKPAAERAPRAEQEDHEEGKGTRPEADWIAAHVGVSILPRSGTFWYPALKLTTKRELSARPD